MSDLNRRFVTLLAALFGAGLLVIVVGERLGLFEQLTDRVPFPLGLALVTVAVSPIFRNVIRAALKRQVTSHTLMTLGVLAALAVGQWATAAVVVFFMYMGEYAENMTTQGARVAVKALTPIVPQTARVEREGEEREVAISEVRVGDTVVVRPGERIPADAELRAGQAMVDQTAIAGDSLPLEVGPGSQVVAATVVQKGIVRVHATRIGSDVPSGCAVKLSEGSEPYRAHMERFADKFTAYYLPAVIGLAALTFLIRHDPMATAAVLVIACSCSIALATPIAMLASIGAGARRGLLIKGGKCLERLAKVDVLLLDKTSTVTRDQPRLFLTRDGQLAGVLAAADTLRPEILAALAEVRNLGVRQIELLTGDDERTAAALAQGLRVGYRANLQSHDKVAVVKAYQAQGHMVAMIGNGSSDMAALAQADVGIAIGAAGASTVIEGAHVVLMRDEWWLVPEVFRLARRTVKVVKMNLTFSAAYNLVGLTLAALGFLPPVFAAAAQSLPDLGILANSSRLLRPR